MSDGDGAQALMEAQGDGLELRRYCPGCGRWTGDDGADDGHVMVSMPARMWIYTNYDCNFSCSYCLAYSSPRAERRGISAAAVRQLVDEAVELGFEEVYFTGGEPFLRPDMVDLVAYSSARLPTTVLSNASLMRGQKLARLAAVANDNLAIQVSLDGATPAANDAYRGEGTWRRAVDGIKNLKAAGVRVRISTTATPANEHDIEATRELAASLGIAPDDYFVRPLVTRGFSDEGLDVGRDTLLPEITIDRDGVYWHPVSTDDDLFITNDYLPLRGAMEALARQILASGGQPVRAFR